MDSDIVRINHISGSNDIVRINYEEFQKSLFNSHCRAKEIKQRFSSLIIHHNKMV